MPLFEIETLVTFRHKYIVEADELQHAYDEIVNTEPDRNFDELTQKYLGEQIIGGREISKKKFNKILDTLKGDSSEMSSHWMAEKIIHKVDYTK